MVNFFQISMGFKYDVLVGSIPTQTASRASRRFPLLLWTHNTGRTEFLTVGTKGHIGIRPPNKPPLWKRYSIGKQFLVYVGISVGSVVRVSPDIQVFIQDHQRTPQQNVVCTVEVSQYMKTHQYFTSLVCGLSTLLPYLLKQPVLEFLAMLQPVGKRHIVSVAIVPVSTTRRASLPLRQC